MPVFEHAPFPTAGSVAARLGSILQSSAAPNSLVAGKNAGNFAESARWVHFVGTPPIIPGQVPPPPWAHELDGSRKVVLVTQGTVANHNFNLLVGPTLAALANEPDVLVVATAGGRPTDAIPGPVPFNARVSSYLPFEWLLPKVDVLVTNGGYGSVNQAMSFGIPLVTAGLTEDKADVNARVAWSGVGINLATNEPSEEALRRAVRTVLDQPGYRLRARQMADEFAAIDTRSEILRIHRPTRCGWEKVVGSPRAGGAPAGVADSQRNATEPNSSSLRRNANLTCRRFPQPARRGAPTLPMSG